MQTDDNSLSFTDNNSTNNDAVNKNDTAKKVVIKINDEYKQLISQLTLEEYEILKKSISETKGNVVPIILNKQGVILDGYHRYRACKELGIDPKIEIKEFSDPIYEKEFIITIHLNRRQLNFFQIAELGVKLEEIEKEKAKLRLSKGGKIGSDIRWKAKSTDDDDVSSNGVAPNGTTLSPIEEEEKGRTLDIVAKKIGMSSTTYSKARKIISEGTEEEKQRLREGKDKIDKIHRNLQKEKKKSDILNPIKQSSNQNDKVKSIKFKIPKERQIEINEEFNKCNKNLIVECHVYDKTVSIKADIFKENNPQQSNPSTSNDQYNNNDTSNDDYTY